MANEIIDIIDEQGRILRQVSKSKAHKHGWLHRTVIGYLRDGNTWTLVRQTPDRQDAGQLVAPVGGHVKASESDEDALLRESEEEIGTRNISYRHVGSARFHRQVIGRDENHLFVVYEISTPDKIVLGDEAESLATFTDKELKRELRESPQEFGDAMYFVLEHLYADYLHDGYVNRWKK